MLKIRLQRVGRKHEPAFRVVLTDSLNSTKSGRFKEVLGSYDPRKLNEVLKTDRIKHWLSMGATATATVHNLLIKKGIIRGKKIDVSAGEAPAAPVEEAVAAPVAAAEAAPAADAPTVETPAEEVPAPEAAAPAPAEEAPVSTPEPLPEAAPEAAEPAVAEAPAQTA